MKRRVGFMWMLSVVLEEERLCFDQDAYESEVFRDL